MSLAASITIGYAATQERAYLAATPARKIVTRGDRAAGAGLVSVSTTRKGSSEPLEALKIDNAEARFVRLQKNVGIAGKLHQAETEGKGYQVLFVTLTYRNGDDWRGTHLTAYMDKVRNDYRAKTGDKLRYAWVGETQERGAIHYHVIFWVRRSYFMKKADKAGWWTHGMTKTEKARLNAGSVVYLMGYIKKQKSKEGLPHGARIFGVGGLTRDAAAIRRWVNLPSFVQARASVSCKWRRAVGGGWTAPDGCHWPAEWGLSSIGKGYTRVVRLHAHPQPAVMPSGPFSWLSGVTGSPVSFF